MTDGFKEYPLSLNQGREQLATWDAEAIKSRGNRLARQAAQIWSRPEISTEVLETYRRGFDGVVTSTGRNSTRAWKPFRRGDGSASIFWLRSSGTARKLLQDGCNTAMKATGPIACCRRPDGLRMDSDGTTAAIGRDPQQVLTDEGVRFVDAVADPAQQLSADDLRELVDDEEV